jgi:hypothetical protein
MLITDQIADKNRSKFNLLYTLVCASLQSPQYTLFFLQYPTLIFMKFEFSSMFHVYCTSQYDLNQSKSLNTILIMLLNGYEGNCLLYYTLVTSPLKVKNIFHIDVGKWPLSPNVFLFPPIGGAGVSERALLTVPLIIQNCQILCFCAMLNHACTVVAPQNNKCM